MRTTVKALWFAIVAAIATFPSRAGEALPGAVPEAVGLDASRLRRIDDAIDRALQRGDFKGAVVLVARHGAIAYSRAAGLRAADPRPEPMTRDTVFDLASLTKPVATSTAVMILMEEGRLRLEDRIVRFLPELDNHGKGAITIEQLLRHRAGLIPDNPLADYEKGPEAAWKRLWELELTAPPGEQFRYSDIGFLILGKLVERVSGRTLDRFVSERVFDMLGMKDTRFRPLEKPHPDDAAEPIGVERIAPTERDKPDGAMLRGVVHDPRARALGGVAGHAGLFATADDLAIFAAMISSGGLGRDGRRVLSPLTVRAMVDSASTPPGQRRGLGWDVDTSYSTPRGALFGRRSFGHTGFTGTSLWIDPETDTFVIILTSRLHPDGKAPAPSSLRAEVATLAAAAIVDVPAMPPVSSSAPPDEPGSPAIGARALADLHPVRCGIDVLVDEGFITLRNLKVGLVTNHTGRARDGKSTIDVLFRAPGVKLVKLFSPEHGIRGELDTRIPDGKDESTGLPIVSLYGESRKPRPHELAGLDALVYDIQDIGARFYTYITTLGLVLEAARESGKKVIVLDRPNPIGGVAVSGPVRDAGLDSFIAYHALPVRHGMTVGELALLYNTERKIGASLVVVRCRGWRRDDLYDRTGLVWINPSPNMRSLTEAMLYPGVGLLEATNLATGRGTDAPFERVGAPWIDPAAFASALNSAAIPGVRFVPIYFTPSQREYAGRRCGGVQILVTCWARFDPLKLGVTLARELRVRYAEQWRPEGLLRLLANRATYQDILARKPVDAIMARWNAELAEFQIVRKRYLLY
jgi:uncharacterized protein YbbC (DUF1343 family)/CubicO group peptidase (beta-lactamase class C family)